MRHVTPGKPRTTALASALTVALTATPALAQDMNRPVASAQINTAERRAPFRGAPVVPAGQPFLGEDSDDINTDSLASSGARGIAETSELPEPHPDVIAEIEAAPEAIVGWDSRMRFNTAEYPNRAIVMITRNGFQTCTGYLVGADTVVTAGHCIHPGWGGVDGFHDPADFVVFPGRDGISNPFGSCTVASLHSVVGWAVHGNAEYDYGAMKLNCNIGNTVGFFGVYNNRPRGLRNAATRVIGYPCDNPALQMGSSDRIRRIHPRTLCYRDDTFNCQSGSPLWNDRNHGRANSGAWAFGVHAYGHNPNYCGNPGRRLNMGVRFRPGYVSNIVNWINL